mgnify:CR=1 FL=1
MIVAIQDANILIDLCKTGLLEPYAQLGFETYTSDLVYWEVRGRHNLTSWVEAGHLQIVTRDDDAMWKLLEFKQRSSPALSLQDCSVLLLAIERNAVLLTGDNRLRREATEAGVKVHGVLWLFDQLVGNGILPPAEATERLRILKTINPRLPADECEKRFKRWASL